MSESLVLRKSYEDLWLIEGYLAAFQFREGWVVVQVTGREYSVLKPFSVGSVSARDNLSSWNDIQDGSNRHYLEPYDKKFIKQIFWGVTPPQARVFIQYPSRVNRGSLIEIERTITGDVGYIDGYTSPYDNPSPVTEMWTWYNLYPVFNIYNPLSDTMYNVRFNFQVMTYTYEIIKDRNVIKECLTAERRCRKHTIGGIDPKVSIPMWLKEVVGEDLLSYTRTILGD